MGNQGDGLASKPNDKYFMVSLRLDGLWLVDLHEYWERDGDFDTCMSTNRRLTKTSAGWHNVEVFVLPLRDRPVVYVPVPGWWVDWEPSCLLFVTSPSAFAYNSRLMVCGCKADKAHIWRIKITEFLILALGSLVAAALDIVFMSKTDNPGTVVDYIGGFRPDAQPFGSLD